MIENSLIKINESEVKEALIGYINKHKCVRLSPMKKLTIGSIDVKNAFKYTLETFSERRETKWKYYGYRGGQIDGEENGPIPDKWHVVVNTPGLFCEKTKIKLIMPHSEEVKICHFCHGIGSVTCMSCGGMGGSYVSTYNSSTNSNESQYQTCSSCFGSGRQTCLTCSGYGKLLWYLQLKITWQTFQSDCFINEVPTSIFPNKLIDKGGGQVVFDEESNNISPVNNFPDAAVMTASLGFYDEHRNSHESDCEKILRQKHQIKTIPLAMIDYEYKKKNGKFYVYGNERRIYFPKYPGNYLRFCTIL